MTSILPLPETVLPALGHFHVPAVLSVHAEGEALPEARKFTERLEKETRIKVQWQASLPTLTFVLDPHLPELGPEGYQLSVHKTRLEIRAWGVAGLFYGSMSLLQLLRPGGLVPCQQVMDRPRFRWRGLMLDVARHFMPVSSILGWLDVLAELKMNTFHWHLTDDQGWRIPVSAFPRLTEVGGWRKETLIGHYEDQPWTFDGTPHGGVYTPDDIQQVIQYAQERFITVIPEIELPGHAQAALAAHPEFGSGERTEVLTSWGISERVFHPRATTLDFLNTVLLEVAEMFPSPYVCIGGDECPTTEWENSPEMHQLAQDLGLESVKALQGYVTRSVSETLEKAGKKVCGWEEILQDGLSENTVGLIWLHAEKTREAVQKGHPIVVCHHSHLYLDYYQSDAPELEPLAQGGCLPLEKVYQYDPMPAGLTDIEKQRVLGVQTNLWTEYLPTPEHTEYMLFPRLFAVAEMCWTPQERRNLEGFLQRIPEHLQHLQRKGIRYRPHLTAFSR